MLLLRMKECLGYKLTKNNLNSLRLSFSKTISSDIIFIKL